MQFSRKGKPYRPSMQLQVARARRPPCTMDLWATKNHQRPSSATLDISSPPAKTVAVHTRRTGSIPVSSRTSTKRHSALLTKRKSVDFRVSQKTGSGPKPSETVYLHNPVGVRSLAGGAARMWPSSVNASSGDHHRRPRLFSTSTCEASGFCGAMAPRQYPKPQSFSITFSWAARCFTRHRDKKKSSGAEAEEDLRSSAEKTRTSRHTVDDSTDGPPHPQKQILRRCTHLLCFPLARGFRTHEREPLAMKNTKFLQDALVAN